MSTWPSMGAIMCMGVATANSVLVVTFANELLEKYKDPYRAALEAGYIRIRPVLMTALAMIIGMVPMAFVSVIGLNATCTTWAKYVSTACLAGIRPSLRHSV